MSGFGGAIKLTGESEYKKALSQINQSLKETASEMKVVTSAYDKNDKSEEALTAQTDALNKKYTEQDKKLSLLKQQYNAMSTQYAQQTEKHNQLVKTYNDEKTKLEEIGKTLGTSSKEYQDQKKKVDELSQEVKQSTQAQDANEKSMSNMRIEINKAQADCNKTAKELDKLGDEAEKSGSKAEKSGNKFAGFGTAIKKMSKMAVASLVAVGTASVAVGKKVFDLAGNVAEAGDAIEKNSQKVGLSYESYQKWDYAMKIAGTSMADCTNGLKTLTNKFDSAMGGSKSAVETFNKLGLSMDDLKGKSREEIFGKVVESLQNITDDTEKATIASKLFGKSGQNLLPLFNETTEETQKLLAEAEKYGMVMSDDAVDASASFKDSLTKLKGTMTGVKNSVIGDLLPSITSLMDGFSDLVAGNDGANESIKTGISGMIASLTGMIPKVVQFITTMSQAVLESAPMLIKALAQGLLDAIPTLAPVAVDVVLELSQTLVSMLPQLVDAGIQIMLALINGLTDAIPQLIDYIPVIILRISQVLIKNLPQIIEASIKIMLAIIQGLTKAMPQLIQMIPTIIKSIAQTLQKNLPMIIDGGKQIIKSLISGIGAMLSALGKEAGKIGSTILSAITGFGAKMLAVGKNLVEGIWKGISNGLGWIKEKLTGWVGNVTGFIKKLFGIKSPSKVFRDEIGRNLALGIGEGFSDEMRNVSAEMGDSIPKHFDIESSVTKTNAETSTSIAMVEAFKDALSQMKIVLDDEVAGEFIDKTVTRLIYA